MPILYPLEKGQVERGRVRNRMIAVSGQHVRDSGRLPADTKRLTL